ncbi:MAG: TRAP transporter large permease [Micrococcaceae bacterium]
MTTNLSEVDRAVDSGVLPPKRRGGARGRVAMIVSAGLILLCLGGIFFSSSGPAIGTWSIGLMVVLLFLGVPVGVSLAVPSLIGLLVVANTTAVGNVLAVAPYNTAASWDYSVLPMFIFMSMLLTASGMTTTLYRAAGRWLNWLPGGLGIATTVAGAGLASVSGSSTAMTYALARAGVPEMLKAGYNKRMAFGTVLVAGMPGALIPPSILLVVYAGIASVPVGPQLIAGVVPGLMVALCFAVTIFFVALVAPKLVGKGSGKEDSYANVTWKQRFQSLLEISGFPLIMIVLFGGMFSGIFTPTEAGAAASLVSLIIAMIYARKSKPLKMISDAAYATISATAAIFFVIIGSLMLTRLLAATGLAPLVTEAIIDLGLSRIGFMILMIILYVIMGMFFDTMSMMLLTVPILLPTLVALDINLLWFGVFVVFMGEIGMITPPVGVLPYIVYNIAKKPKVNHGQKISLGDIFIGISWFIPIVILILVLLIAFPEMVDILPALLEGGAAADAPPA